MNLDHLDFDIVSYLELRISDLTSLGISTLVKSALQIRLFLQNKANFRKSQINVNYFITMDYERMVTWSCGKNKANSNPNKANFRSKKSIWAGNNRIEQSAIPHNSISNICRLTGALIGFTISVLTFCERTQYGF